MDPLKQEFIALFELSGWSQAEAGRQLHLTRGGVNGIITGKASVSAGVVELMRLKVSLLGKRLDTVMQMRPVAPTDPADADLDWLKRHDPKRYESAKVVIQSLRESAIKGVSSTVASVAAASVGAALAAAQPPHPKSPRKPAVAAPSDNRLKPTRGAGRQSNSQPATPKQAPS